MDNLHWTHPFVAIERPSRVINWHVWKRNSTKRITSQGLVAVNLPHNSTYPSRQLRFVLLTSCHMSLVSRSMSSFKASQKKSPWHSSQLATKSEHRKRTPKAWRAHVVLIFVSVCSKESRNKLPERTLPHAISAHFICLFSCRKASQDVCPSTNNWLSWKRHSHEMSACEC